MRIETPKDKGFYDHDFKASWLNNISYEEWNKFLSHNYSYSREEAYSAIKNFLEDKPVQRFLEIGFGQCYDFECCFKDLHRTGKIIYSGWEITAKFSEYARQKFPEYSSQFYPGVWGFADLPEHYFNIIYTRHTLEHQNPLHGYDYFNNILKSTFNMAVVTWFKPPANEEKFTWNNRDGKGKGAYVNTYSKKKLLNILDSNGFNFKRISIQVGNKVNEIWIMIRGE